MKNPEAIHERIEGFRTWVFLLGFITDLNMFIYH